MKIALIGAGSSVGRYLLSQDDERFIGTYRSERALSQLCDLDLGSRLVKAADPNALVDAIKGCDAVVTLINDTNPNTALKSLRQAVDACVSAGVPQLIHVGSAAIYGRNADHARTAESAGPVLPWNSYAAGKQWQENYLKRYRGRLPSMVVLRPGLIWGPGMAWLHAPAGEVLRREAWIAEGDAPCNLVNIRFLSHAILHCAHSRPSGLTFCNIYDHTRLTWTEYYRSIARHLEIKDCKIHVVPRGLIPPWLRSSRAARDLFPLCLGWSVSPQPLKYIVKAAVKALPRLQTSGNVALEPLDSPHLNINRELWELKTATGMPPGSDMLKELYRTYPYNNDDHWADVVKLRQWMCE